jgi:hypothetical protein
MLNSETWAGKRKKKKKKKKSTFTLRLLFLKFGGRNVTFLFIALFTPFRGTMRLAIVYN